MIDAPMQFRDPFLFLLGVESSIRRVLRCPRAIWLGMALVGTASIAREYDAVSWVHQPADLLGPFAASLVLCTILFVFIKGCLLSIGRKGLSAWQDYRVFLTGYWMTAPLAWLYAIPIEKMADEVVSLKFNLTLLSVVSIWRVLLFSRVVAIQFGLRTLAVLPWVLVPCMVIAFFALLSAQLSVVSLMGGIRLTQTQQILVDFQSAVAGICFYGILPMLLLTVVGIAYSRNHRESEQEIRELNVPSNRVLWAWPIGAAIVLLGAAVVVQPKLYRSANVDAMLRRGKIEAAVKTMNDAGEKAFPIVWDPPPKYPDRGDGLPDVTAILKVLETAEPDDWVADRLLVQADEIAMRQAGWFQGTQRLEYVRRQFAYQPLESIRDAIESLHRLQAFEHGDAETIAHRTELLGVLAEVLVEAEERQSNEE